MVLYEAKSANLVTLLVIRVYFGVLSSGALDFHFIVLKNVTKVSSVPQICFQALTTGGIGEGAGPGAGVRQISSANK